MLAVFDDAERDNADETTGDSEIVLSAAFDGTELDDEDKATGDPLLIKELLVATATATVLATDDDPLLVDLSADEEGKVVLANDEPVLLQFASGSIRTAIATGIVVDEEAIMDEDDGEEEEDDDDEDEDEEEDDDDDDEDEDDELPLRVVVVFPSLLL